MKKLNLRLKKSLHCIVFICVCSISTSAQQSRDLCAKFYTGFYYLSSKLTSSSAHKMDILAIESVNMGISWKAQSRNLHEFSIFGITKKVDNELELFKYEKIGLRYEYNFALNNNFSEKLHLYIGGGLGVFYANRSFSPKNPNTYGGHYKVREIIIHAIPRLVYTINENIFLDFNIPVSFFNYGYNTRYSKDPALPARHNNLGVFLFRSLEQVYVFRLGIGYKFQ